MIGPLSPVGVAGEPAGPVLDQVAESVGLFDDEGPVERGGQRWYPLQPLCSALAAVTALRTARAS